MHSKSATKIDTKLNTVKPFSFMNCCLFIIRLKIWIAALVVFVFTIFSICFVVFVFCFWCTFFFLVASIDQKDTWSVLFYLLSDCQTKVLVYSCMCVKLCVVYLRTWGHFIHATHSTFIAYLNMTNRHACLLNPALKQEKCCHVASSPEFIKRKNLIKKVNKFLEKIKK